MRKLGLIAGNGRLPRLVAEGARASGVEVVACAHVGETQDGLSERVDALEWVRVGELGKIIKTFKRAGCDHAVMAGGITKAKVFEGGVRPDLRGAVTLAKIRSLQDDRLLRGIADELEGEGLPVIASTAYMPDLVPREGVLSRRSPSKKERADIEYGCRVVKAMGPFEIGQSVVVKDGLVLAVEAVEGTDAAVRRGGELSRGGAVVVKVAKPGQDLRFDVPAVGPTTIDLMSKVGARVLALEAERTLILDRDEMIAAADAAGIAVVAFAAASPDAG